MKNEPVALIAAIAVIVVTVASAFKVVLDTGTVETLLLDVVILAQAVIARSKVTPAG
jgi:preprotein translocase subunit SecF